MLRGLRIVLALACLLVPQALLAQTTPPAGISQEQFDALVKAISQEVVRQLRQDGTPPRPPAAPAGKHDGAPAVSPEPPPVEEEAEPAPLAEIVKDEQESIALVRQAGGILGVLPELAAALGRMGTVLEAPGGGARTIDGFFALLAVAAIIAIGAEAILRALLLPLRQRLSRSIDGASGLGALLSLAALDGAALASVWVAAHGLAALWFPGQAPQDQLATAVLASIFAWRLYMFAFRLCFRPGLAAARLAEIDNRDARQIYFGIAIAIVTVLAVRLVLRSVLVSGVPDEVVASGQLVAAPLLLAVLVAVSVALRRPVSNWLIGLSRQSPPGPVATVLARNWLFIAIPFFVALAAAQAYGAVMGRFGVPSAVLLTLNVAIGVLLLETAIDRVSRLFAHHRPAPGEPPRLADAIARFARTTMFVGAALIVADKWLSDTLDIVDVAGPGGVTITTFTIALTVLAAAGAWEVVKFATARYATRHAAGTVDPHAEDGAGTASPTTRLATLMPLLRVALAVVIVVLAVLTVLSQFGVNVTALIAGASVVGLAVSFGSQTLVKDIVSGVFYLIDDAFRVGEYIDCGKAKGTVEGFTLRSLRLRHQNGQVHTIPFGQLGQITNFSRDWTTMKFNLRFARDTDLEQLRKTVKRIGQEMLEDPELKEEILIPLKMQGVADIADNALVVRFKVTVRPSKPTFVQREALKRMFKVLPEQGIDFANAMVAVQTLGPGDAASSGAAARALQAQAQADAVKAAVAE